MTTQERLRKADYCVVPVPLATARRLVWLHHYARGGGSAAAYTHGLFAQGAPSACLGVAWWAPPIIGAARSVWPDDPHAVLALTRLAIAPEVPANAASFLIARSVKLIRADGRYRALVTYADTWRGHTGAIYRASNWEYLGTVQGHETWTDATGQSLISDKKWTGGVSAAELRAAGCVSQGLHDKHKYRLILEPARAPRTLFDRLRAVPGAADAGGAGGGA